AGVSLHPDHCVNSLLLSKTHSIRVLESPSTTLDTTAIITMNQIEYDKRFGFTSSQVPTLRRRLSGHLPSLDSRGLRRLIQRRIPCTKWLSRYQWKEWLARDAIAGATLGIYNIPQGMAYSVLASLAPVYGLYAAFFPPLLYFIFGSSFHSSFGVFSITSLLAGQTRLQLLPDHHNHTEKFIDGMGPFEPIDVVSTLTFAVGIIQLLMAALRLDFLTAYLSDPVVSGFNLGAACHALIAQVPSLLGVKIPKRPSQFFLIFKSVGDILSSLPQSNLPTIIVSSLCILFLIGSKSICSRFRLLKLFPNELVLMIVVTVISLLFDLKSSHNVRIIEHVETGMPLPSIPDLRLVPYVIQEAVSISIVAFAVTVSMGKLFGKKHKYSIDTNQELLALGLGGSISSFFSVFPCSTSLSRSLVNEAAGAMTQMSGLFSSLIVLLVILWIGPLLSSLPLCVLSSIVVVALRSLFMKISELPYLWRFSRTDFAVWVITATAVICYDIIEGLALGIVFALFTVILRTQFARTRSLVEIAPNDYRDRRHFPLAKIPEVPIIRFDAPPIFTNCELLRQSVKETASEMRGGDSLSDLERGDSWKSLILDCSTWTYTDSMGVEVVRELHIEMCSMKILLLFANLRSSVRVQYSSSGLYNVLSDNQFYPTIEDAISIAGHFTRDDPFSPFPDLQNKLSKYINALSTE
ncbi:hypothetical protein PENTCL1PPCAC_7036, partial [Pristionchus entomophagus]